MIVKDEQAVLARCLEKLWFADEIIVVDTGSSDDTVAIAKTFTEKVYFFEWSDDFAAARNFSFGLAECDLIMWLDADDVITLENGEKIAALKERDDFDTVFLKYAMCEKDGSPTFVYYRERIFRRSLKPFWEGTVHEVVNPVGRQIYSDAVVLHRKINLTPPMRNLKIYQSLISKGVKLDARQKFYYGRELYFNAMYVECVAVLRDFLSGEGWVENKIEACRTICRALLQLGKKGEALNALLFAFTLSRPRAEDCCLLGGFFEEANDVKSAIFWYECALSSTESIESGAFVNTDYLCFFPAMRLCVLYDKSGDYVTAEKYNEMAGKVKPKDESYLHNKKYFKNKRNER